MRISNLFYLFFKILYLNPKKYMYHLFLNRAYNILITEKIYQRKNFEILKQNFTEYYNKFQKYNIDKYLIPLWNDNYKKLEDVFLPYPPFSFLRDPIVRFNMFVTSGGIWLKKEIQFIRKKLARKNLKRILLEDFVGDPILINYKYITSHNTIHHLYHILKFINITKCNFENINRIIEWGGGYGNMAKIFKRLTNNILTYIIIDIPLFSCIQWLYLTSIFGKKEINLIKDSNDKIHNGKINIVPLCFMEELELNGDIFISTWGLSESSPYSQDYVINHKFFNSKHILLAYQENKNYIPYANRIDEYSKKSNFFIEKIDFIPSSNYYAMK